MIPDPHKMVIFLKGLRHESGAYADSHGAEANLRPTLSALKILSELGAMERDPQTVDFIRQCRHENGGFSAKPHEESVPFVTAVALICLKMLGQEELLQATIPEALAFMTQTAESQYDHFMLIAAYEECAIDEPLPVRTLQFFENQLAGSLADGSVLETAIAAASLIRAHRALPDVTAVTGCIHGGQDTRDGGFGDGEISSLMTTYCAVRTFALLDELPNARRLLSFFEKLQTEFGYAAARGGPTSAGVTYQILSMFTWLRELQRIPVQAARRGDIEFLRRWLAGGGMPDMVDADGWTVLLAAAARGQAATVDFLLNHDIVGVPAADPNLRYEEADALPIYMAGQTGDVETVKLLLAARPEHLHAISSVNGHTVLLQAAFYGKAKHLKLADFLLDHAAELSGLPAAELAAEQAKMLSATNVRGYSALTMQDLWHNEQMKELLLRYHEGRQEELAAQKEAYYQELLLQLATPQALTEKMMEAISRYLDGENTDAAEARIDVILSQPHFNIDRLGNDLQQTPLIFAITGVDVGQSERAERRHYLAKKLLQAGADPAVREKHPMAIGAVIRASVLNNFGLLQLIASYMTPEAFAREMNTSPAVNGLTAMHDATHRALTSPPDELQGHLDQIKWMIAHGARLDLPDNIGQTQRELAEAALDDPAFPRVNAEAVWAAINSVARSTAVQPERE